VGDRPSEKGRRKDRRRLESDSHVPRDGIGVVTSHPLVVPPTSEPRPEPAGPRCS
jgi:hypothetical protein